ncbi:hypothetical protein TNCV_379481 [Trichonephila clavipes]|nr:hypothetical protein TNCV_379481 [Trichonephila clavipes]
MSSMSWDLSNMSFGPVQHVIWDLSSMSFDLSNMSWDLSNMSWDLSSMSFGTCPACHLTCPACPLTPVSIVALGWHETFSLGPENSFGGKFENFYFAHT